MALLSVANIRTIVPYLYIYLLLYTSYECIKYSTLSLQLLPVHFLSRSELGREQEILREWLDVAATEEGAVLVARQAAERPPLLVAQLTEEWLNHYRKIA